MTKLSERQQKIIDLMAAGWELGVSGSMDFRAWLQRDGIGRGGPTENLNGNTFTSLSRRKLIRQKEQRFPTSKWELTEAGRELARVEDQQ